MSPVPENRTLKLNSEKDFILAIRKLADDLNRLIKAFNNLEEQQGNVGVSIDGGTP